MADNILPLPVATPVIPSSLAAAPVRGGKSDALPLLTQYWRVVVRWRWLLLATVLAALVLGLLVTLLMTPQYTAKATIEIARQENRVLNVEGVQPERAAASDLEFYQTQYALLKSRSLAERVAGQLRLADNDAFFESFDGLPEDGLLTRVSGRPLTPAQRAERTKIAVAILQKQVDVQPVRGSSLVDVEFESPDPKLSLDVTNAWTQAFVRSNLDRRFEASAYARRFLEDRLAQLRQRLEQSERQLVNYATNERLVNVPAGQVGIGGNRTVERPLAVDELTNLSSALSTAVTERVQAESRLASARGAASAEALNNPAIASLRGRRAEVSAEYAKMLVQFEPGYPPARALASQLAQLDVSLRREESRISESINGSYTAAVQRERDLRTQVEGLKDNLLDQRKRSIQYNIYQRDVDTTRELYDGLLQRYKEIGAAAGVGTNNLSIIDPAQRPEAPSSPILWLNLLIALMLGLAVGVAAILVLEQIDEGLKDPSDVDRAIGRPLLGAIPRVADLSQLDLLDRKSPVAEAYLSVQTALSFSTDHGFPKSVLLTSSRPGEAKSTSALALAITLARVGKRAVLIDGDLRSPSVHQLTNRPNEHGVSDFLAGENNLDALLMPFDIEGVSLMAAGPQPPNAAELLASTRLRLLIDTLLQRFDHVIVDAPPVLGLADAPLIASQVEGVIYVVETRGPRSTIIRSSLDRLESANAHILGVLLTKFDSKKAHLGYGYDYGYGYGYGAKASAAR